MTFFNRYKNVLTLKNGLIHIRVSFEEPVGVIHNWI